jgi:hypothetical protein
MRIRGIHLLLAGTGLGLLGLAAYTGLHSDELRRAWILRFDMHERVPGILVNDSLHGEDARAFAELVVAGRLRAAEWFGSLQNKATVVVVHDNDLRLNLGMPQPFTWNPVEQGNRMVYVGPRGLSVDVIAHAIAHAEIKARAGLALWPSLPAWFDEGVATQVDRRAFLDEPIPVDAAALAQEQLEKLSDHHAFTGEDGEQNLAVAKRELTRWLRRSGGAASVDQLIAAVRGGEAFTAAYARLEAGAGQ